MSSELSLSDKSTSVIKYMQIGREDVSSIALVVNITHHVTWCVFTISRSLLMLEAMTAQPVQPSSIQYYISILFIVIK